MQKLLLPRLLLILCVICLSSCDTSKPNQHPAAPLDNKEVLESLASAYETVAETIPVSPMVLRPAARKKFVEQVFAEAEFNYSDTLIALSKVQAKSITQYHKDIKQLLFLPHYRVNFDETKDIYTDQEIEAIKAINRNAKSR